MPKFMLLGYQPVGGGPAPEEWQEVHAQWTRYDQSVKDAGVYIANEGLGKPEAAVTVRVRNGETQVEDGPFAETAEYLANFYLIEVPDLGTALKYAAEMPSCSYGSVEVRPLWG